ncbi:DUF1707 domain-containing protein [Actinobacteria bacterium YIM 96077]|uniref:DUF1707 domain-containing protein n=1 Tax=Phytoactinopolyspora halophila TaxID=1981511 RepID=A0A329QGK7_9ACTN|nr:DUF1707 domain-containing protein [Phytoactinopolyspora halophila]AYY14723.1 DUF1707 domain-containing protein [Actinobacteria bacterium YIM 96077]RAW11565.1 DUF1707 domain-containing protein [Phytoactinopolyspora halophila]
MASRSDMRAGDEDRERATEILQEAHGDGRLSHDELMERLESAYTARTFHDLDRVIDDLPIPRRAGGQLADQIMQRPRSAPAPARRLTARRVARVFLNVNWWVYGTTVALSVVIWLLVLVVSSYGVQHLWPLWVAGPWGVVLGAGELAYRRRWPGGGPRPGVD